MRIPEARTLGRTCLVAVVLVGTGTATIVAFTSWNVVRALTATAGLVGSGIVVVGAFMMYRMDPDNLRFRHGTWDDPGTAVPNLIRDQQHASAVVVVGAGVQLMALVFAILR